VPPGNRGDRADGGAGVGERLRTTPGQSTIAGEIDETPQWKSLYSLSSTLACRCSVGKETLAGIGRVQTFLSRS